MDSSRIQRAHLAGFQTLISRPLTVLVYTGRFIALLDKTARMGIIALRARWIHLSSSNFDLGPGHLPGT